MKDDRLVEMRVLRAVVDTGGFSSAARALGTSQPFVSQTVYPAEQMSHSYPLTIGWITMRRWAPC